MVRDSDAGARTLARVVAVGPVRWERLISLATIE